MYKRRQWADGRLTNFDRLRKWSFARKVRKFFYWYQLINGMTKFRQDQLTTFTNLSILVADGRIFFDLTRLRCPVNRGNFPSISVSRLGLRHPNWYQARKYMCCKPEFTVKRSYSTLVLAPTKRSQGTILTSVLYLFSFYADTITVI